MTGFPACVLRLHQPLRDSSLCFCETVTLCRVYLVDSPSAHSPFYFTFRSVAPSVVHSTLLPLDCPISRLLGIICTLVIATPGVCCFQLCYFFVSRINFYVHQPTCVLIPFFNILDSPYVCFPRRFTFLIDSKRMTSLKTKNECGADNRTSVLTTLMRVSHYLYGHHQLL